MLVVVAFFAGVIIGALASVVPVCLLLRPTSSLSAETRRSIDAAVKRARPPGKLIDARDAFRRRP